MQRRKFFKIAGLFAALSGFPLIKSYSMDPKKKINFRHVVYFWLHEPENKSADKQFLNNLREFIGGMDNILDVYIGIPADTNRDVVDNTYQYSINLGFESKEEHDIYQAHPIHKVFIEKTSHLWSRVQVYDSVPV